MKSSTHRLLNCLPKMASMAPAGKWMLGYPFISLSKRFFMIFYFFLLKKYFFYWISPTICRLFFFFYNLNLVTFQATFITLISRVQMVSKIWITKLKKYCQSLITPKQIALICIAIYIWFICKQRHRLQRFYCFWSKRQSTNDLY